MILSVILTDLGLLMMFVQEDGVVADQSRSEMDSVSRANVLGVTRVILYMSSLSPTSTSATSCHQLHESPGHEARVDMTAWRLSKLLGYQP